MKRTQTDEILKWELERNDLWQAIFARINREQPTLFPTSSPGKSAYLTKGGKIDILMELTPSRKCIKCHLWITNNKDHYKQLESQRAEIEAEVGQPLSWNPKPETKSASVYLKTMIDPKNPANREQVIAWFAANAVAFYKAFNGRRTRLLGLG